MTTRPQDPSEELLLTQDLLERAKTGDHHALGILIARYRPRLERWAAGRLPGYARSLFDTGDLVQEALMRALESLNRIEVRGPGMFQAYMRRTVLNRICDQLRTARARYGVTLSDQIEGKTPSPLESAIGADLLERYEVCLSRLSEEEQRLLHLRLELDLSYAEIGAIMERTPDSARMAAQRALGKLAKIMGHER